VNPALLRIKVLKFKIKSNFLSNEFASARFAVDVAIFQVLFVVLRNPDGLRFDQTNKNHSFFSPFYLRNLN